MKNNLCSVRAIPPRSLQWLSGVAARGTPDTSQGTKSPQKLLPQGVSTQVCGFHSSPWPGEGAETSELSISKGL